MPPIKSYNVYV